MRGLCERADTQLAANDWIAGSRSIADPYLYVVTRWAKAQAVDLSGLDNLARFAARMEADRAVRTVLAEAALSRRTDKTGLFFWHGFTRVTPVTAKQGTGCRLVLF